ncbi:hypothetical protein BIFGAL_03848 [Bifidobacterium gallicum DSM 20093 = LMG 11596]|uniref:Uncharacterized protein n=1 Tax=Bifidobacterium gallicum DSM 20093 = LMG 11596 TaxID=561180 RepID=D1NVG2_9BIFI|nr:hypothetical protein BIFGAL_03848 [Bifidobacterium gallicum DSM 20093 = LMG 11596]
MISAYATIAHKPPSCSRCERRRGCVLPLANEGTAAIHSSSRIVKHFAADAPQGMMDAIHE